MTVEVHIRINSKVTNRTWRKKGQSLSRVCDNKEIVYDNFVNLLWTEDNRQVYTKCIADKLKESTNLTIFAYGQTGSGKTHTMLGNNDGMIIYCLKDLLLAVQKVFVSYIEIYNEKMYDLSTNTELKMFTLNNKPVVDKLSKLLVSTIDEGINFIQKCELNRRYGFTEYNSRSSRSHTIFQISYTLQNADLVCNLIDLAGSEKACKEEVRRAEGAFINKSLLALCTVINNLRSKKYFGFRDSKLTRILQNSLDGATNVVAFCMISPSDAFTDETISTLSFASRLMSLDLKKTECVSDDFSITKPQEDKSKIETSLCQCEKTAKAFVSRSEQDTLKQGVLDTSLKRLSLKQTNTQEINMQVNEINIQKNAADIMNEMPYKHSSTPKFSSAEVEINLISQERDLLHERIQTLEEMIGRLLRRNPDKRLKDIFILEKHMFVLKTKHKYIKKNANNPQCK